MNELILKLMEQAGLQPYYDAQEGQIERFAELIVQECFGEIMCQLYDYNPSSNEQYNAGHEAGLKLAVSKIKEHFGVEE